MRALALLAAAALAGCATASPDARPAHGTGRCDAARAQQFLGQFGSQEVAAKALAASRASVVRWLWPGTAASMEYNPGRLDIELSQEHIIMAFRCG